VGQEEVRPEQHVGIDQRQGPHAQPGVPDLLAADPEALDRRGPGRRALAPDALAGAGRDHARGLARDAGAFGRMQVEQGERRAAVERHADLVAVDRRFGLDVAVLALLVPQRRLARRSRIPIGQHALAAAVRPPQAKLAIGEVVLRIDAAQEVLADQPVDIRLVQVRDEEVDVPERPARRAHGPRGGDPHQGEAGDAADLDRGALHRQPELPDGVGGEHAEEGARVDGEPGLGALDLGGDHRPTSVHADRQLHQRLHPAAGGVGRGRGGGEETDSQGGQGQSSHGGGSLTPQPAPEKRIRLGHAKNENRLRFGKTP
jgi:hypothetical protein